MAESDRTASLMTPAKLAKVRPKAVASPAAWLDQMAADAGHQHLHRMAELRAVLETHARGRASSSLLAELVQLGKVLPRLDFGLLQPSSLWARATGKSRDAGKRFAGKFEKIDQALQATAARVQALQEKYQGEAAANERALVEVEVKSQAIEKIIEQGGRWLQDIRGQLQARSRAGAADAQSQLQIRDDTARCDILIARLKVLRGVADAAQRARQQAQAAAAARAAVLQVVKGLAPEIKAWHVRLWTLASGAADGKSSATGLEGAIDTHHELQLLIKQAAKDSAELQAKEQALAAALAALGQQLEASI